jgi:hypothetical protein
MYIGSPGGGNIFGESPGSKRPLMAEKDGIYDMCVDYIYVYLSTCMHVYQLSYVLIDIYLLTRQIINA